MLSGIRGKSLSCPPSELRLEGLCFWKLIMRCHETLRSQTSAASSKQHRDAGNRKANMLFANLTLCLVRVQLRTENEPPPNECAGHDRSSWCTPSKSNLLSRANHGTAVAARETNAGRRVRKALHTETIQYQRGDNTSTS